MIPASDVLPQLYSLAWYALLVVVAFYLVVAIVLRWAPSPAARMTLYEPPRDISPAIAAFLWSGGRYERPFAAALISLAAKGRLRISQDGGRLALEKLPNDTPILPPEEAGLLTDLFPGSLHQYSFNDCDSSRLFETYGRFQAAVQGIATPQYMTTHVVLWLVGFAYLLTALEPIVFAMPAPGHGMSYSSIGFVVVMIALSGSCFVAALRVWPATLQKLASFLPGSRQARRRLNANDLITIRLTVAALVGFAFLAVLTSTRFALLAAAVVAVNILARHLLDAPTQMGRTILSELRGFREFLARTDRDQMNRENQPDQTPHAIEDRTPYAVALCVERGWGEEFSANLLELLQMDEAYSRPAGLPLPDERPPEPSLFGRKK